MTKKYRITGSFRQYCRLSIHSNFGWVWRIQNQKQIQIPIWWWHKQACLGRFWWWWTWSENVFSTMLWLLKRRRRRGLLMETGQRCAREKYAPGSWDSSAGAHYQIIRLLNHLSLFTVWQGYKKDTHMHYAVIPNSSYLWWWSLIWMNINQLSGTGCL